MAINNKFAAAGRVVLTTVSGARGRPTYLSQLFYIATLKRQQKHAQAVDQELFTLFHLPETATPKMLKLLKRELAIPILAITVIGRLQLA